MALPSEPSVLDTEHLSSYEKERLERIAANLKKMEELGVSAAAQDLAAETAPKPKERKARQPKPQIPMEEARKSGRERKEVSYKDADYLKDLGRLPGMRAPKIPRNLSEEEMQALREKYGIHLDAMLEEDEAEMTASQREAKKSRGPVDSGKGVRIMGGKVYDSKFGVTCHWCRQKTLTENVTCTNPNCGKGKRIPTTFCKGCLRNRHGECSMAAAASGCWECPQCRGSCGEGCVSCCNCGPCRKKKGMDPTGQIKGNCVEAGFCNAHDYLVHLVTGETASEIEARKLKFPWGAWLSGKVVTQEERDASASAAAAAAAEEPGPKAKKGRPAKRAGAAGGGGSDEVPAAGEDPLPPQDAAQGKPRRGRPPKRPAVGEERGAAGQEGGNPSAAAAASTAAGPGSGEAGAKPAGKGPQGRGRGKKAKMSLGAEQEPPAAEDAALLEVSEEGASARGALAGTGARAGAERDRAGTPAPADGPDGDDDDGGDGGGRAAATDDEAERQREQEDLSKLSRKQRALLKLGLGKAKA